MPYLKQYLFLRVFVTSILGILDKRYQQREQAHPAYKHATDNNHLAGGTQLWRDAQAKPTRSIGRKTFKCNREQPQVAIRNGKCKYGGADRHEGKNNNGECLAYGIG